MFFPPTRRSSLLVGFAVVAAASWCAAGEMTAQSTGDSVRARVRDSEHWMSGRFQRFDSVLVLDQADGPLQLQRDALMQVQVYRRRSPLVFLVVGTGLALAGYQTARWIAGPDSDWACSGCGITWHEGRDYLVFGAGGLALGAIAYFILPPRWKTVFRP